MSRRPFNWNRPSTVHALAHNRVIDDKLDTYCTFTGAENPLDKPVSARHADDETSSHFERNPHLLGNIHA